MAITIADPKLKIKLVDGTFLNFVTYTFPGFDTITITGTSVLGIDKEYHRLWDGAKAHVIPPTWLEMTYEVADGGTAFLF